MSQNNIAVIPARGGSKRIPKKNIKDFLGKPVIAYSIKAALQSGLFEEVIVSTDSEEIASIAKQYGASVPFLRSAAASGDFATTIDVLSEVYNKYLLQGKSYKHVCCVYACAPFVNAEKLKHALSLLKQQQASTIFPIIKYGHPIQRAFEKTDDFIKMTNENNLTVRTQDLPARYHDAGQFYWLTAEALLNEKKLVTAKTVGIEVTELDAHDIDSENDWKLAELKYKLLYYNH